MSLIEPEQRYFGITKDLKRRLADRNAGKSPHTAKFKPWRLETYMGFSDRDRAAAFERYLKTGSGKAFSKKRLAAKDGGGGGKR